MKKLLGIMVIALMGLGFMACSTTSETITLSSEQSLASMAYLSGNMLKFNATEETNLAFNLSEETIEVEDELETVNEYLEMLKAFMENGASGFGSISEQASDRAEFEFMLTIVVAEQEYKLYYNVDAASSEISGIFLIDGEEYTITAYNDLDDSDEYEDEDEYENEDEDEDDEDEYEDEDEYDDEEDDNEEDLSFTNLSAVTTESSSGATVTTESSNTETETNVTETTESNSVNVEKEHKMVLIARNGENYVEMTYKVETENKETETKFEMESYINGVEKEISIEIKIENNEYKIEIEDGDNSYEFKREVEGNGIEYKLEYEVNGVEGEIKILETENELGEKVYIYEIEEEGKYKEVEIDDDDDFEDEEEDETEDLVSLM
jgi:hypothetical protein